MTRATKLPNVHLPLTGYLLLADMVRQYEAFEDSGDGDTYIKVRRVRTGP